jgi:hypothetical protein
VQRDRGVERGLPAQGGQDGVGPFAGDERYKSTILFATSARASQSSRL